MRGHDLFILGLAVGGAVAGWLGLLALLLTR